MPDNKKEKELKEVPKEDVSIIIEDNNTDEEEIATQTDFEEKVTNENTKHSEREFSEEVYRTESEKMRILKRII